MFKKFANLMKKDTIRRGPRTRFTLTVNTFCSDAFPIVAKACNGAIQIPCRSMEHAMAELEERFFTDEISIRISWGLRRRLIAGTIA